MQLSKEQRQELAGVLGNNIHVFLANEQARADTASAIKTEHTTAMAELTAAHAQQAASLIEQHEAASAEELDTVLESVLGTLDAQTVASIKPLPTVPTGLDPEIVEIPVVQAIETSDDSEPEIVSF